MEEYDSGVGSIDSPVDPASPTENSANIFTKLPSPTAHYTAEPFNLLPIKTGVVSYNKSGYRKSSFPINTGVVSYSKSGYCKSSMPINTGVVSYGKSSLPINTGVVSYGRSSLPINTGVVSYGKSGYRKSSFPINTGVVPYGKSSLPIGVNWQSPSSIRMDPPKPTLLLYAPKLTPRVKNGYSRSRTSVRNGRVPSIRVSDTDTMPSLHPVLKEYRESLTSLRKTISEMSKEQGWK